MKNEDYATKDRQAFIRHYSAHVHAYKIEKAKVQLGAHYLFHEANRVQRCPERTPGIAKPANVAKTFERAREERGLA